MAPEFINRLIRLAVVRKEEENPPKRRTPADYAALFLASWGIGYLPIAPATWGSLVGVVFYLVLLKCGDLLTVRAESFHLTTPAADSLRAAFLLVFVIGLFLIGIWAATRVVDLTGKKDPRIVIIDEIVGQLITYLFIPAKLGWGMILIGFLAFRFFDIWKPYPADKLETLPLGLGVMADDVMAGFYAAALTSVIYLFYLTVF